MATNKLQLGYWAMGGSGHPIRVLLHYLGQDFENVTFPMPQVWLKTKQELIAKGTHFINMPWLQDGDLYLSESDAIALYLAHKFDRADLYGKNTLDKARVRQLEGVLLDYWKNFFKHYANPDKKAGTTEAFKEGAKAYEFLDKINNFLGDNEFLIGYLTYADFKLAYYTRYFRNIALSFDLADPYANYPNILAHAKRFYGLDEIKEFEGSENDLPYLPSIFPWYKAFDLP